MSLAGKVALVTGASKGIGRGVAVGLAAAGAPVVLVARNQAELDEVATEIKKAGGQAVGLTAELGDAQAIKQLAAQAQKAFGPIDILVNNAAIPGPIGYFPNVDLDAWTETQVVNFFGPVRLSHALLPAMLEKGWGRVLNMSSGAARSVGAQVQNAYSSSKGALETHTRKLAQQLEGSGVTANVLRPGATDTPMQTHMRNQDPAVVGPTVEVFKMMWNTGIIKPVEVPVKKTLELLAGDDNGLIVEMRRQKNPDGKIQDVVELLATLG